MVKDQTFNGVTLKKLVFQGQFKARIIEHHFPLQESIIKIRLSLMIEVSTVRNRQSILTRNLQSAMSSE
ncbi:hypothetical protein TTHERM_000919729 (macronuclear) [Tetrahymena thermophila SB210]|uniref:Uncharacterized protein n=1 Tax=Tetrahymena thermophila (strain SB210) TaxID=312017 RepID=W7WVY1_TETTS|nr:hypothetical protein TTHERM_000919729 [Tetrahymena thermophila SB210]EWS70975.1 hypothetical protein TTHERM_000919729 [Tetrahymena thermophila SB210]|eukprot:XP_012656490.1 hypothetical protein TTHERM_000919729 [Tetrahymena thermophila SB210]